MMKEPKLKYKYKIGQRVILKHAGTYFSGWIRNHTSFKAPQANAKTKSTYTVKGDNGFIYPLLGVDGTMNAGNILSEDTKAGYVIERASDYEVLERPKGEEYKIHNLNVLREIAKKRKLPKYGSKGAVIDRLLAWDNINKDSK
jgi:hypothetical protein